MKFLWRFMFHLVNIPWAVCPPTLTNKCVFVLIIISIECLTFTPQDDLYTEWFICWVWHSSVFSHSFAEGGKFLCAHLWSDFYMWNVTTRSQLWFNMQLTSIMWKLHLWKFLCVKLYQTQNIIQVECFSCLNISIFR